MTVVSPIPARTVDGWDLVTLAPTSTPAADSWTFTVLAGGMTLTGSGATRTFTAPAVFAGTTVQIGVTATSGGATSPQRIAVYTVRPWNSFVLVGTSPPKDSIDGNVSQATFNVVDGGTASSPTNVLNGGTASLPADVVDARTGSSAAPDVIDGGTVDSTPTDTFDGGIDAGLAWIPRQPIQLI